MDHVPVVASITKSAATVKEAIHARGHGPRAPARLAMTPHSGPTFLDFPLRRVRPISRRVRAPSDRIRRLAARIPTLMRSAARGLDRNAERPAFMVGSDVYWGGAWEALRAAVETLRVPCLFNGLGRGCSARRSRLAFSRARGLLKTRRRSRGRAWNSARFRLGFGLFGNAQVAQSSMPRRGALGMSRYRRSPATRRRACLRSPTTPARGSTTSDGSPSCAGRVEQVVTRTGRFRLERPIEPTAHLRRVDQAPVDATRS